MQLNMLKAKIHRATVTECDLHYEGSISIDRDIIDAVGFLINERVDIYNINNGERFSTYVIEAPRGSGEFGLNGAAARRAAKGDKIIICSYCIMSEDQARVYVPTVILMDDENRIKNIPGLH